MKLRKIFLWSLVVQVALSQLLLFIFIPDADIFACIEAILVTCASWTLGLFFGLTLSVIIRKPKIEAWLYICGQLLVYTILSVFVSTHKDKFNKQEGNYAPEVYEMPDLHEERERNLDEYLNSVPGMTDSLKQQIKDSVFKHTGK